jgi:hypothetical protein
MHDGQKPRPYPVEDGIPLLLADHAAAAANERRARARAAVTPLARALGQRPLPWAWSRSALRSAVKAIDFVGLPLGWRDKLRLVRRYRRWR